MRPHRIVRVTSWAALFGYVALIVELAGMWRTIVGAVALALSIYLDLIADDLKAEGA